MLVGLWYGCLFHFPVLYLWLISSAVGLVFALGGVLWVWIWFVVAFSWCGCRSGSVVGFRVWFALLWCFRLVVDLIVDFTVVG